MTLLAAAVAGVVARRHRTLGLVVLLALVALAGIGGEATAVPMAVITVTLTAGSLAAMALTRPDRPRGE